MLQRCSAWGQQRGQTNERRSQAASSNRTTAARGQEHKDTESTRTGSSLSHNRTQLGPQLLRTRGNVASKTGARRRTDTSPSARRDPYRISFTRLTRGRSALPQLREPPSGSADLHSKHIRRLPPTIGYTPTPSSSCTTMTQHLRCRSPNPPRGLHHDRLRCPTTTVGLTCPSSNRRRYAAKLGKPARSPSPRAARPGKESTSGFTKSSG